MNPYGRIVMFLTFILMVIGLLAFAVAINIFAEIFTK